MTSTPNMLTPRGGDFSRVEFDNLIFQKGREVIHEKALQCPCKSKTTNQQSNCKNCGGTGWIFINPNKTRMVIQSMSVATDYKAWSEEVRGMINISCTEKEQLTFMDRVTILEGNAIFNEVLHFKKKDNILFTYSSYNIKKVLYCGLFIDESTTLTKLTEGPGADQFTIENNIVKLGSNYVEVGDQDISITLRYYHAPAFHIVEMKRESMESFEFKNGQEKLVRLPLSGMARRAHYILTAENLLGDRLLDNSYDENVCEF